MPEHSRRGFWVHLGELQVWERSRGAGVQRAAGWLGAEVNEAERIALR